MCFCLTRIATEFRRAQNEAYCSKLVAERKIILISIALNKRKSNKPEEILKNKCLNYLFASAFTQQYYKYLPKRVLRTKQEKSKENATYPNKMFVATLTTRSEHSLNFTIINKKKLDLNTTFFVELL